MLLRRHGCEAIPLFGASKPPPIATQVRTRGTLQTPRRIMRSTVSSWVMLASWKCVWMPLADSRLMCSSTHSGPAGIVISRYAR